MALDSSDTDVQPLSRLDYAPTQPRRLRIIRGVVGWLVIVGLAFLAVRRGPEILRRSVFLYHQRGCLRYAAPPDEVVFDSNPARVAVLAGDPNYVIVGGCAYRKPPADWVALRSGLSIPVPSSAAVIFLHQRVVKGVPALVEVERTAGASDSPYFIPSYDVDQHCITPASMSKPAADFHPSYPLDVIDGIGPHDIRIYAGQIDPADDSRFTVRYDYQGKSHVVDGRLAADGSISFQRPGE